MSNFPAMSNPSIKYILVSLLLLLVSACNSGSSTHPLQLSPPEELRTIQALQYSQIYAEISVNGGAPQRFDFSSDVAVGVNVTDVLLGEENDITISWYENFLGEPLILATQSGSFTADPESRRAVISFEYNYDHNDDGDSLSNIDERSMGQCPWIDSRCEEVNPVDTNIEPPVMLTIPAGTFLMGSVSDDAEASDIEKPQHSVTIAQFSMAESEVTWGQWNECVANNGCEAIEQSPWLLDIDAETRDLHPVGDVTWAQTQDFIAWINFVFPGNNYRLPSEAEFEYALRANTTGRYFYGDAYELYCDYANGSNRACQDRHLNSAPVKSYLPNPFGLYDINGNVGEWVQDCQHRDYVGAPDTGEAWLGTTEQCQEGVLRGGNHVFVPGDFRITVRRLKSRHPDFSEPHEGFRLAAD